MNAGRRGLGEGEGGGFEEAPGVLCRGAHNIKGAARGVEVEDVARIAHSLETLCSTVRREKATPSAETIDLCLVSLDRMREAIRARLISVLDLKNGILAFDDAAQRLAMVSGKAGPFQYPLLGNHARDALITFARSLHR